MSLAAASPNSVTPSNTTIATVGVVGGSGLADRRPGRPGRVGLPGCEAVFARSIMLAVSSCTMSIMPLTALTGNAQAGGMNNADFSTARTLALGDPLVIEPCRLTDRLLARAL